MNISKANQYTHKRKHTRQQRERARERVGDEIYIIDVTCNMYSFLYRHSDGSSETTHKETNKHVNSSVVIIRPWRRSIAIFVVVVVVDVVLESLSFFVYCYFDGMLIVFVCYVTVAVVAVVAFFSDNISTSHCLLYTTAAAAAAAAAPTHFSHTSPHHHE